MVPVSFMPIPHFANTGLIVDGKGFIPRLAASVEGTDPPDVTEFGSCTVLSTALS